MDRVFSVGLMEGGMKGNTCKIKSMDLEYILGRMGDSMQASGKMVSNMAKEFIKI